MHVSSESVEAEKRVEADAAYAYPCINRQLSECMPLQTPQM